MVLTALLWQSRGCHGDFMVVMGYKKSCNLNRNIALAYLGSLYMAGL